MRKQDGNEREEYTDLGNVQKLGIHIYGLSSLFVYFIF